MGAYTVVITGASGSAYGMRTAEQLLSGGHEVVLVATEMGRQVMSYEIGFDLIPDAEHVVEATLRFLELPSDVRLRVVAASSMFDPIASGTHVVDGMIVSPCSMGFAGSLASGLASDLAERAADVMLKERRPLVLVPRETPLNVIHLRNLTSLAEAGAVILPASPAFYQNPESIDDLIDFVVGKTLDALRVEHDLFQRWGEPKP